MAADFVGRLARALLSLRYGNDPIPFEQVIRVRRFLWGRNPLAPHSREVRASAASVEPDALRGLLDGAELGTWSLHPATIAIIRRAIHEHRPRLVIELGSGWSTVCLAFFLREVWGDNQTLRLVSIEQDAFFAATTRQRLAAAQLEHLVDVKEVPLVPGSATGGYAEAILHRALAGLKGDMFVIDGPAGSAGIRRETLPQLVRLACAETGAVFFLDDALRDAELRAATEWKRRLQIKISGVALAGAGLLVGRVESVRS